MPHHHFHKENHESAGQQRTWMNPWTSRRFRGRRGRFPARQDGGESGSIGEQIGKQPRGRARAGPRASTDWNSPTQRTDLTKLRVVIMSTSSKTLLSLRDSHSKGSIIDSRQFQVVTMQRWSQCKIQRRHPLVIRSLNCIAKFKGTTL